MYVYYNILKSNSIVANKFNIKIINNEDNNRKAKEKQSVGLYTATYVRR